MEIAKQLWNETLRNFNYNNDVIVVYAAISDLWRNRFTKDLIKDVKKYGKSLGFKVEVKQEKFNWLIIRKM